ncbi:efflux RND transporter periplasmic adaptor subunit [Pseudomonas sp. L-22-4S-12]|uniref:efflux RND transporter periplasmic adaptor subunit n=1 Tax=Pseudomonas sp. L-22-4S-12 TaxID=2610893 RepID=UPI001329F1E9|nr:efflux RND transporter periplasmic adaptor subunit [Pseudomonas sp. L-22-4S-12]MWV16337.1 efflux RND transporter periplasmic adaptor subunit [Pseudomonas sp. L-22-4S-12]
MLKQPASAAAVSALALAILALSGCGEAPTPPAAQVPQVGVVTLAAQPYTLTTELPGRTAAFRIAEVRPQVDGIIQKRLFTEGSEVKAGQQLYQIDAASYAASLKSAEASQVSARSLAVRYKELVVDKAVSQQAYDEAEAARLQAEAALEKARIDLRYTRVLAPIAGRVGRSTVTEGALVSNGQSTAMATIQQLDPIYVDVTQSSAELLRLRRELAAGQLEQAGKAAKVSLTLEDGSTYPHSGILEFSEVSVDEGTGSVTLRAVFPNPAHDLLPGMFVHARLNSAVKQQAILAPQQGVTRDLKGQATALVVGAGDKVELRQLQAERTSGNRWLVSAGLQAGDRLITEGLQYVRPGDQVKVAPAGNVAAEPSEQSGLAKRH